MRTAVRKAEAAGFVLPPMDFDNYGVGKEGSHVGPKQVSAVFNSEPATNWVSIMFLKIGRGGST